MRIPQIVTGHAYRKTFRFQGNLQSGTGYQITAQNIIDSLGVVGKVANTSVAELWQSFKLHRVTIWAAPPTASFTELSLEWEGNSTVAAAEMQVSASSISQSVPLVLDVVPPAGSQAAFWSVEGSGDIFFLSAITAGSSALPIIIDLDLTCKMLDGGFAAAATAVTTCVVGELYYLPLDGVTTHALNPVGLASTF